MVMSEVVWAKDKAFDFSVAKGELAPQLSG